MFRKGLLFFILIICTAFLQAQTFEWANNVGGKSQDLGYSITSDKIGNNYFAGRFTDTVIFNSDTLIAPPSTTSVILGKHNKNGKENWAAQCVNKNGASEAKDVALDGLGNVYITGWFTDTIIFNNNDTLIGSSNRSIFVAKFDTAGNYKWAVKESSGGMDEGYGITANDSSVYICGTKGGDAYLGKLNFKGQIIWNNSGKGKDSDEFLDIQTDDSGNLYCTGRFRKKLKFGTDSLTGIGGWDIHIAKFNSSGSIQWLKQEGGTKFDEGNSIALRDDGSFIVTGSFFDSASFDSISTKGRSQFDNAFIAYYDNQANIQWLKQASGKNGFYSGQGVTFLNNDFAFVTGRYNSVMVFGNDTLSNQGSTDIFIFKLKSTGKVLFSFGSGGLIRAC